MFFSLTGQQGPEGLQDGADAEGRRPLLLEDVEANVPLGVDVGVEARRLERDERRLVGVRVRENQLELVRQPLVLLGVGEICTFIELAGGGVRWVNLKMRRASRRRR